MSEIAELVAKVREAGYTIERQDGELKLVGKGGLSDELLQRLRSSKAEVLLFLRHGTDWERLRELGSLLGCRVRVDGREVTLWGLTPRGAIVDTGAFLLTVGPEDIDFSPQPDQPPRTP